MTVGGMDADIKRTRMYLQRVMCEEWSLPPYCYFLLEYERVHQAARSGAHSAKPLFETIPFLPLIRRSF